MQIIRRVKFFFIPTSSVFLAFGLVRREISLNVNLPLAFAPHKKGYRGDQQAGGNQRDGSWPPAALIVATGIGVVIAGRVGSKRSAVQTVEYQLLNHMSLADMQISSDRLVHADRLGARNKTQSHIQMDLGTIDRG